MKKIMIAIVLLILSIPSVLPASSQPLITAINFRVRFNSDGTVVVALLQHPFFVGRQGFVDMYGNESVMLEMMLEEEDAATEIALMFSEVPEKVDYEVLAHTYAEDEETVLCDVDNVGRMKELHGAIVLEVLVHLSSTPSITESGDEIYEVRVADCYTRIDPRSWIDVIEFEVGPEVELISYDWSPSAATGPKVAESKQLLWENFNELEAPNEYSFKLRLSELEVEPGETYAVSGHKAVQHDVLEVVVKNEGGDGYFIVRALGDEMDQARKVHLEEGEERAVRFAAAQGTEVEVWHEDLLLQEIGFESPPDGSKRALSPTVAVIFTAGITLISISLFVAKRSKGAPEGEEKSEEYETGFDLGSLNSGGGLELLDWENLRQMSRERGALRD